MISIIIPAYNEETEIAFLLERINKVASEKRWEVIAVDDGSTDKTTDIIKRYKFVSLIKHPYNKGYGASIKTAINNSRGEKIVLIDADNQHDPANIETLLFYLDEFDLVVGARGKDTESELTRSAGNYILRKLAGFLVGKEIPDLTCGFRAFNKEKMIKFLHLYPNGFSISATSLLAFISAGYNVKFVPLKMYMRNKTSKSKISLVRDGLKFFLLILRMLTLFNPLKIFFPMSILLFLIGASYGIANIFLIRHIPAGAVLLVLTSMIIFFFGLIADQISCIRREIR